MSTPMKLANTKQPAKQSGAALMVSMVLIFMLSILGIASMRDATLETQLASNSAQKELTFQSAESATDVILAIEDAQNAQAIESTICQQADTVFQMQQLDKTDAQTTTVTLQYGGKSLPTGWTLGGPIGGRRFVVTGESILADGSTHTRVSQGVVAIGAVEAGSEC